MNVGWLIVSGIDAMTLVASIVVAGRPGISPVETRVFCAPRSSMDRGSIRDDCSGSREWAVAEAYVAAFDGAGDAAVVDFAVGRV
jgi:hypothetical protein